MPGKSQSEAWQTLTKVNNYSFVAGDTILFKRGGVWTGGLIIQNSGTANAPITYSAYGDKDPNINNDPVFENPGNDYQNSVEVVNGVGYIVIENFMLRNAHQSGVIVRPTAHHVTVQDCEATKVGCGVYLVGHDNLVQRCYFHHLTMIVNSRRKGGDDYGALGVNVNNSNNEVRNCTFIDCNAPSYDYGTDGGAVEIYAWLTDSSNNNINVDNINIHHNYALRTNGFTEIGGDSKTPAYRVSNVKIYQNVWEDTTYDLSMMIHYGGSFGVDIENIQVNNNTIVQHNDGVRPIIWGLIGFTTGANPLPNDFSMRNNIIYSEWIQQIVRNGANIGSNHNIIF
ncbi:MAG TPA: hypothetical protein PK360_21640, partial [bacterium]|nr:hypothetical protein [bacterium]